MRSVRSNGDCSAIRYTPLRVARTRTFLSTRQKESTFADSSIETYEMNRSALVGPFREGKRNQLALRQTGDELPSIGQLESRFH